MGNKDWFVDSEIIGQGSADQGFEGMRLHKEALEQLFQQM